MKEKFKSAKKYVAEHPGSFLVGSVVVYVYSANLATAVVNLKALQTSLEIAKVTAETAQAVS